jgi:hypothetical protein
MAEKSKIKIGWASADLTPEKPSLIAGQFHARVSEGVMDPVTATAMAIESGGCGVVMVSCDLVTIPPGLLNAVRERILETIPEIDPQCVFLNATHTHTGPEVRVTSDALQFGGGNVPTTYEIELPVMSPEDFAAFAAGRIAEAVMKAWQERRPSAVGFGIGQAVVGRNRRSAYLNGESRMYGNTNEPQFSHIEGYEDHAVNVLGTWDGVGKLTGLVVNVACPSQVSESDFRISADYWNETREELRGRLGENIFVLAQCSAAGDQSPHIQVCKEAEERMWRLSGRTERQEIAVRIADAVCTALSLIEKERIDNPLIEHKVDSVELSRRKLSEHDVAEALEEAEKLRAEYEELRRELDEHPEKRSKPRWYVPITGTYRKMKWYEAVKDRYELEQSQPKVPVEVHLLRIGDMAFATNPFEYYLDFGMRIKARSPAIQTFVVQLTGSGTYVPTERAVAGRSYGAVPASAPVGPEGGQELVEWTVRALQKMWGK